MKYLRPKFYQSPSKLLTKIRRLREEKGREEEVVVLINKALDLGYEFVLELLWEEALVYQHKIMSENTKPESKRDKTTIRKFLRKWEEVVNEAKYYIEKYELTRWKSRLHRFLGRISDYKGDYKMAVREYKKAIKFVDKDPQVKYEKLPRKLELEAFISYSMMMSGKIKEGLLLAKRVYEKFDNTSTGRVLKRNDLPTWIIWKTGIPIRTTYALIENKMNPKDYKVLGWLQEANKLVSKPVISDKWGGKVDFEFRRNEIASIKRRLG